MNTTFENPITSKCMISDISITGWGNTKTDSTAGQNVTQQAGAKDGRAKVVKTLIESKRLRDIQKLRSEAYALHNQYTLPWLDKGGRLIVSSLIMPLKNGMDKLNNDWLNLIRILGMEWPNLVNQAQYDLGSLYDSSEIPSWADVEKAFTWTRNIYPVPDVNDFRVDLVGNMAEELSEQYMDALNRKVVDIEKDVAQRLSDSVSKIVSRIADYTPDAKTRADKHVFTDTVLDELRSVISIVDSLNITENAAIREAAGRARYLLKASPQQLREDGTKRKAAVVTANSILDSMQAAGF